MRVSGAGVASLTAGSDKVTFPSLAVLDFVPGSARAARALIALGLAGSVPAAAAGLADWSALHREQQRVGLAHGAANAGAWALFAGSLLARATGREASGRALAHFP